MAQYKFEGDLENITGPQLDFINKVVQAEDLDVDKVIFLSLGKPDDNFGSNVKRIIIEGKKGSMKMIVKTAPADEAQRKASSTNVLFKNEHFMYVKVLPKFMSLQRRIFDVETPEEDFIRFAKCYGSFTEAPNEVIILEDLCESEYVTLDKFKPLSFESMQSILKSLAAFHTLSYALKEKDPETYEYYKSQLVDVRSLKANDPEFKTENETFVEVVQALLDEDDDKKLVKNTLVDIPQLISKLAKWEQNNKRSVIVQGDAWTQNIMFEIQDGNIQTGQTVMLNFQGSANNNPMVDVLYTIFCGSDAYTRACYYYDWLDYYYSELDKSLANFGLKSNYIYPREQMNADIKRYGKLMFWMAMRFAINLMRDTNEVPELIEAIKTTANMKEFMQSMGDQVPKYTNIIRARKKIEEFIFTFTFRDIIETPTDYYFPYQKIGTLNHIITG